MTATSARDSALSARSVEIALRGGTGRDLASAPDASGVDQDDLRPAPGQAGIDRVAGRARDVRDDRPVLAEQRVQQAGLAHVGPAQEGDRCGSRVGLGRHGGIPAGGLRVERRRVLLVELLVLRLVDHERFQATGRHFVGPFVRLRLARLAGEFLIRLGREGPHDGVQQVSRAPTVRGRDGVRLVPAEGVEFRALEFTLVVVRLVDGDDDRRGRAPQEGRRLVVRRREPRGGIDHEQDDIRLADGQAGLLLHACLDRIVGIRLQAARVHDDEPAAVPLRVTVQAVTGRPGTVLHDRLARAEDPVEERALADVRPTDDGDDREGPAEPGRRGA
ncbi:MAG: hypothetical protein WKF78_14315 [Candidatus Limnocylindrales bacterium]